MMPHDGGYDEHHIPDGGSVQQGEGGMTLCLN
jgi:hypothetical protein